MGPERYNDRGELASKVQVIWKFTLADPDTGQVLTRLGRGDVGEDLEVWAWTSDSTYYDVNGTMTSRARKYMHALAGRVLSDDEVTELFEDDKGEGCLPYALVGARAIAELNRYTTRTGREFPESTPMWQAERAGAARRGGG